jgi:hypothetical protein
MVSRTGIIFSTHSAGRPGVVGRNADDGNDRPRHCASAHFCISFKSASESLASGCIQTNMVGGMTRALVAVRIAIAKPRRSLSL